MTERTLPVQLLVETRIFWRPHIPMLPEHKPRNLGCWSDPAAYNGIPFGRHKDNGPRRMIGVWAVTTV